MYTVSLTIAAYSFVVVVSIGLLSVFVRTARKQAFKPIRVQSGKRTTGLIRRVRSSHIR